MRDNEKKKGGLGGRGEARKGIIEAWKLPLEECWPRVDLRACTRHPTFLQLLFFSTYIFPRAPVLPVVNFIRSRNWPAGGGRPARSTPRRQGAAGVNSNRRCAQTESSNLFDRGSRVELVSQFFPNFSNFERSFDAKRGRKMIGIGKLRQNLRYRGL